MKKEEILDSILNYLRNNHRRLALTQILNELNIVATSEEIKYYESVLIRNGVVDMKPISNDRTVLSINDKGVQFIQWGGFCGKMKAKYEKVDGYEVPKGTLPCWRVDEHRIKAAEENKPYPDYRPTGYFKVIAKTQTTIEGNFGHLTYEGRFHDSIINGYDYFIDYKQRKPVYFTFDNKVIFYLLEEILPGTPLLFKLKRITIASNPSSDKLRTDGIMAGIRLEKHLKNIVTVSKFELKKEILSLNDLNEILRINKYYDKTVWRKISLLGDIRNICAHNYEIEPTADQIKELVAGVDWIVKNI